MTEPSFPIMSALAQVTRWRVFEMLLAAGDEGMLQHEIATRLGVSTNLLSIHLKVLKAAGVVTGERSGREVTYRATSEAVREMAQSVLDTVKRPRRTGRTKAIAEAGA